MKTNEKLINPKTVGRSIALGFCAFTAVLALAILASCDNEPKPKTCQCPNGTEHLPGSSCCDFSNCTCTKVPGTTSTVEGKATTGIPITNRGELSEETFKAMVAEINTALDHTQISSATRQAYIKANIKEIKIDATQITAPIILDNTLIVGTTSVASDIRSRLNGWLADLEISILFKQMDNSKNTVRMAFGKVMGQRMI